MERRSRVLLIYNINLPRNVVWSQSLWRDAIERTDRLIHNDLLPAYAVYYEITASYHLKNTETGEPRLWTGSFFSRGNAHAQLGIFREYDETFVDAVSNEIVELEDRLAWFELDTKWVFDRLESVIINVQAEISSTHTTLQKRHLSHHASGGRHTRNHITFGLP